MPWLTRCWSAWSSCPRRYSRRWRSVTWNASTSVAGRCQPALRSFPRSQLLDIRHQLRCRFFSRLGAYPCPDRTILIAVESEVASSDSHKCRASASDEIVCDDAGKTASEISEAFPVTAPGRIRAIGRINGVAQVYGRSVGPARASPPATASVAEARPPRSPPSPHRRGSRCPSPPSPARSSSPDNAP